MSHIKELKYRKTSEIRVPAQTQPHFVREVGRMNTKSVVISSSGWKENHTLRKVVCSQESIITTLH